MKRIGLSILVLLLALPLAAFATAGDEVFATVGGSTLCFSSGAGGWATEVVVFEDGSFVGYFYDADMGDSGEGYPDGTLYECAFFGTFSVAGKIDEYAYELRLDALHMEEEPDTKRYSNGIRVITTDAYGISGGDVFMLYCPGRKTQDLPEAFLKWICMPHDWAKAPDMLPFYGLYNVAEETGFFSYAEPEGEQGGVPVS